MLVLFPFVLGIFGCTAISNRADAVPILQKPDLFLESKTFDNSYEHFKSYFKHHKETYSLYTKELFEGREFVENTPVVVGETLPTYVLENWIQPSKFLANETTSYLDEKAGSEVLSKVVETRWQSWNPKAGFWFEMNELERFIFYDYKMISATNGGFWVVWMASFNESHELLSIEDIAVHGVYDTGGYYENENGYGIKSSAYHSNTMLRFESREIISNTYNYVEYFHEFNDIIKEDYSSKERPHSIIIH